MATISQPLSPLFPGYSAGAPDGLRPKVGGNVTNRLILQDGIQGGHDEFNMDTLSVPFKIFAGSDWKKLLPARGDTLAGFPNMVVWDPIKTYTVGKVWVDLRVLLKGLLVSNGVNNRFDGFLLNPKPKDATGIASAQISGTDGSSTADVTFYRPQTVYRYVTTSDIVTPPATINNVRSTANPTGRAPVIISFAVRGSSAVPDAGDDDADTGAATYVGFNLGVRQRCSDLSVEQVGKYFQNEATVVYEFYDTASPS